MTPHAAFIRRAGARHYRCATCHVRVAPGQRVPHLNRATVRAAEYGTTTPTHDLGDDE